jgi:hypothetical protein
MLQSAMLRRSTPHEHATVLLVTFLSAKIDTTLSMVTGAAGVRRRYVRRVGSSSACPSSIAAHVGSDDIDAATPAAAA